MPRQPPPAEAHAGIRLYDRLRQRQPDFPNVPVIVADEIARQIDALPERGVSPPASDYGIVAPPFASCFIEADTVVDGIGLVQRGVLVEDFSQLFRAGDSSPVIASGAPAGTHWLMIMSGFIRPVVQPGLFGYNGVMLVHLDAAGRLLDDTERMQIIRVEHRGMPAAPVADLAGHAPYALKAISAMHQRCAADKVSPPRQQRRAAERAGVLALHDYYVLRVRPTYTPQDMRQVGQPTRAERARREHMVRGHFRYYDEARPMFGRVAGMVWIPEHERGDSDLGRIKKDYEV